MYVFWKVINYFVGFGTAKTKCWYQAKGTRYVGMSTRDYFPEAQGKTLFCSLKSAERNYVFIFDWWLSFVLFSWKHSHVKTDLMMNRALRRRQNPRAFVKLVPPWRSSSSRFRIHWLKKLQKSSDKLRSWPIDFIHFKMIFHLIYWHRKTPTNIHHQRFAQRWLHHLRLRPPSMILGQWV